MLQCVYFMTGPAYWYIGYSVLFFCQKLIKSQGISTKHKVYENNGDEHGQITVG